MPKIVNISVAYDDLEEFDDEALTSANLGILLSLGQLLGVSPAQLLLGADGDGSRLSFEEKSQALRGGCTRLRSTGLPSCRTA